VLPDINWMKTLFFPGYSHCTTALSKVGNHRVTSHGTCNSVQCMEPYVSKASME